MRAGRHKRMVVVEVVAVVCGRWCRLNDGVIDWLWPCSGCASQCSLSLALYPLRLLISLSARVFGQECVVSKSLESRSFNPPSVLEACQQRSALMRGRPAGSTKQRRFQGDNR